MPGISVHAVDVARGLPAQGMRVEVYVIDPRRTRIAEGLLAANGALEHPITHTRLARGAYETVFHVGDFLRAAGLPAEFLDDVPFRFRVGDPGQHCHLPLKFTPWGYSLFRGN
jgi:5-hydroxyisourate hydrolase